MALASVLALPFLRLGGWNTVLGSVAVLLPWWIHEPLFNAAGLQWVGLGTAIANTKDYTPFLPWFGVMLFGVYIGNKFERCSWCVHPLPRWRGLAEIMWLGKHSLVVYLAHQPLLMAFFWLVATFTGVAEK
nr:heparan-alpha-glucosaminide N-acetyltransferase domain-containing protein [Thiothrix subterranea]